MTKEIYHIKSHERSRSHEVVIYLIGSVKCKITYEADNAHERCSVQFFDGNKFNPIFDIRDLGVIPDSSIYCDKPEVREKRSKEIIDIGKTASEKLINS